MSSSRKAAGARPATDDRPRPSEKRAANGAVAARPAETTPAVSPQRSSSAFMVLGTYHSVMVGLYMRNAKFYLQFSVKHHVGCVNAVAMCDKYIATCGYDERVFLFTSKSNGAAQRRGGATDEPVIMNPLQLADLGNLTPPHEVTCMQWASKSQYLLCGCADGSLLAYRSRDWSVCLQLPVHQRRVNSIAVHPGAKGSSGGGRLAVTIGSDRYVAVLDLISGKLLTKWKLHTRQPLAVGGASSGASGDAAPTKGPKRGAASEADGSQRASKKARTEDAPVAGEEEAPLLLSAMFVDEPEHVCFSPEGTYFVVSSRFVVFVYRTATMALVAQCEMARRRPGDELHCFTFASETTLFVGNESGHILYVDYSGAIGDGLTLEKLRLVDGARSGPRKEPAASAIEPAEPGLGEVSVSHVHCRVPEAIVESQRSRGTDMRRLKYPYTHTARVKALSYQQQGSRGTQSAATAAASRSPAGGVLFSVDTHGIVIAWNVSVPAAGAPAGPLDAPATSLPVCAAVELQFLCSANCQGRATSMGVMML